jgi:hypothetical protein
VYFLRLYFNPKRLEISPLEWPTETANPSVREVPMHLQVCSLPDGRVANLLAAGEKQIELAILSVEHAERVRSFFEHLPSHGD